MAAGECAHDVPTVARRLANLRPDGAVRHGANPLVSRGELPAGSEFELFRDVLQDRRREGLAWVGGPERASFLDLDDIEAYARWATAADVLWGVVSEQGVLTRTRRKRAMLQLWQAADTRAAALRKELRSRRAQERDISSLSASEWLERHHGSQDATNTAPDTQPAPPDVRLASEAAEGPDREELPNPQED